MEIIDQYASIILPTSMLDAEQQMVICEYAARNCYNSNDKAYEHSYEVFLPKLIASGHESPLEHSLMVAEIVTGRDVMAELTRHRHAGFSVRSQRYVNEDGEGGIRFIRPTNWDQWNDLQRGNWEAGCANAEMAYRAMLGNGMKNQDARKALPNSTATHIIMSANLREWRHIFKLRTSKAAYPECRAVMTDLLEQAKILFPCVFEDIHPEGGIDR